MPLRQKWCGILPKPAADVQVAADGTLWIVTDEDNGRLIRIAPAD